MLRTLIHYRRINLAVILGAAVATAVLTGALLVGDSVRGSLRDLTLERLGHIDHALVTETFFRESLVDDLGDAEPSPEAIAPLMLLQGSAVQPDSGARASKVAVIGIDKRFGTMFDTDVALDLGRAEGQVFPSVVVNQALGRELDLEVGDALLLSFPRFSRVPRDSLVGDKDPGAVLASIRLTVSTILPERGMGSFGLSPHQIEPVNAFVQLGDLRRVLDLTDEINAVVATSSPAADDPNAALAETLRLEDLGLKLSRSGDEIVVESREFVIRPAIDRTIVEVAAGIDAPAMGVQSYLANTMALGESVLPYSLVAALDTTRLTLADGSSAPALGTDQILLNRWAADDLGAGVGDTIEMTYYTVGPREELHVDRATLLVAGVVAMTGLGAESGLTPDYPGIQETEDISDWDPPFPVDLGLIRQKDEDYWDRYEATPKAFVSEQAGRKLWTSRFGSTTSVRIGAAPGQTIAWTEDRIRASLFEAISPESFGFRFRNVKTEGLDAAAGATDFAGLFFGFSLFLIVSSALLVGLLFSLGVEQRAGEIGLLRAVGYRLRKVRRRLLTEGAALAAIGAVIGTLVGIAYAAVLMLALRTVWVAAVGSTRLYLHVEPVSLVTGWAIAMVVVVASIIGTIFRLSKLAPPALLAGSTQRPARYGKGRIAMIVLVLSAVGAFSLVAYAVATDTLASPGLAFGTGALLLMAGLARFSLWCRGARARARSRTIVTTFGMAARNTSWSPGRSMLSVALVASACFMIVAVASNRVELGDELDDPFSGTGGFRLVAESDIPLHQDLSRQGDRFDLGFDDHASVALDSGRFYPFRVLPGEDASCLNLYRPEKPRVLGVPPELIARGGFGFQKTVALPVGETNPWTLLEEDLEPGVIPAIGDANSAQWILHLGLGQDVVLEDELGHEVRLRFVGLLASSVFQSEVLISEENFLKHWPGRSGYGYFLIDAAKNDAPEISQSLEATLGPFGFDVTTTRDRIAGFKVVEHTYLSTFQMLGGLGLLLGTVGLGVVLMRNVVERRGELATLRAFGFRRSTLAWMVLAENAFLLIVGMFVGTISAVVAVAPRLATVHVPWASLAGTLGIILIVGMLSSVVAVRGALRTPLLPALKSER